MPFKIHHFCSYYSQTAHESVRGRTDDEWAGYRFASAVKTGMCGKGYFFVPEPPSRHRIDAGTVGVVRPIFGRFLTSLAKATGRNNIYIVPVPSKDSFDQPEFRSLTMVRQALPNEPRALLPIVKFKSAIQQAHAGGDRSFAHIYQNIGVSRAIEARSIIIVDDIMTKGGSMLATRKRLIEAGHNVLFGVVCGRTTWSASDVFAHGVVEVENDALEVPFLGEDA